MVNDKNLKSKKIAIVALLLLLGTIIGATYAFFTAQKGTGGSANIEVGADTTDNLSFKGGSTLSIYANADNFKQNGENITDETTVSATLKANNTTNLADDTYNVYLAIETNELDYTTLEKTPELLVTITDPDGKEIEENSDLLYKENIKNVKGFDVTNKTGVFLIAKDFPIEVTEDAVDGTVTQEWHITLTLINLDSDQEKNTGKEVTGKVVITKDDYDNYKLSHINTLSIEKIDNSLKATLKTTEGTSTIKDYYFALKETGKDLEYNKSTEENTYTFTELSENNKYDIYSYAVDSEGFKTNVYETKITLSEGDIPNITNVDVSDISYNQFTINVTSDKEVSKYIYKIKGGGIEKTIEDANSTYTFTDLTELEKYTLIVNAVNDENVLSPDYTLNINTVKKTIGLVCSNQVLSSCIIANKDLDKAIIYHDGESDYDNEQNVDLEAGDYSYRYTGSSDVVNNYVCFDDDCSQNNLYRIIGLFRNKADNYELKLIKATFITDSLGGTGGYKGEYYDDVKAFYWAGSNKKNNNWRTSDLNLINLNDVYYNGLSDSWKKMIVSHEYIVTGNLFSRITSGNVKEAYDYELGNNKLTIGDSGCITDEGVQRGCQEEDLTVNTNIGLMYISDYFYAASNDNWTLDGTNYNKAVNSNWLAIHQGKAEECFITRDASRIDVIFNIQTSGALFNSYVYHFDETNGKHAIRPTFYLNNQVKLSSGEGTITNPYKLVME